MLGSEEGHLSGTRGGQGRFSRGGIPKLVFKGYKVENNNPGRVYRDDDSISRDTKLVDSSVLMLT